VDVKVDYLNRRLVNAMTMRKLPRPEKHLTRKRLGSMRTDIVVADDFHASAMIEVKIRVSTLAGLRKDLNKIIKTLSLMNAASAQKVIAASVFQVHIPGSRHRYYAKHFKAAAEKVENGIRRDLAKFAKSHRYFRLEMHPLQPHDAGIVERDLEPLGDGFAWGADGPATRYHAILVRSTRPGEPETLAFRTIRHRSSAPERI
jgi:hypothetical protein